MLIEVAIVSLVTVLDCDFLKRMATYLLSWIVLLFMRWCYEVMRMTLQCLFFIYLALSASLLRMCRFSLVHGRQCSSRLTTLGHGILDHKTLIDGIWAKRHI